MFGIVSDNINITDHISLEISRYSSFIRHII